MTILKFLMHFTNLLSRKIVAVDIPTLAVIFDWIFPIETPRSSILFPCMLPSSRFCLLAILFCFVLQLAIGPRKRGKFMSECVKTAVC